VWEHILRSQLGPGGELWLRLAKKAEGHVTVEPAQGE